MDPKFAVEKFMKNYQDKNNRTSTSQNLQHQPQNLQQQSQNTNIYNPYENIKHHHEKKKSCSIQKPVDLNESLNHPGKFQQNVNINQFTKINLHNGPKQNMKNLNLKGTIFITN